MKSSPYNQFNRFTVKILLELLNSFFRAKMIDDKNIEHSEVMGFNRYSLIKLDYPDEQDKKITNEEDYYIKHLSLTNYLEYDLEVTFKATFKSLAKLNHFDRVRLTVTNKRTFNEAVKYSVISEEKTSSSHISQLFFYTCILNLNKNYKRYIDNPEELARLEASTIASDLLYDAFFQSPYNYILEGQISVRYVDYLGNIINLSHLDISEEAFIRLFGDQVNLKNIINNDLYLQSNFCSAICSHHIIVKQLQSLTHLKFNHFTELINIQKHCEEIQNKISLLRSTLLKCANAPFTYYQQHDEFSKLTNSYKALLKQLLSFAVAQSKTLDLCEKGISTTDLITKKAIIIVDVFPEYRIITYIANFLVADGVYHKTLNKEQFKVLFEELEYEGSVDYSKIEKALVDSSDDNEHFLLKSLVKAFFEYDDSLDVIKLREYTERWTSFVQNEKGIDRFLPVDYHNNRLAFIDYCDKITDSKTQQSSLSLSGLKLRTFAENGRGDIFRITKNNKSHWHISINMSPEKKGDIIIATIPQYAGLFFDLTPSKKIIGYEWFVFRVRSENYSLEKIKIEFKNSAGKKEDFCITLNPDWQEERVCVRDIPDYIIDDLSEIVFLVEPVFIKSYNLNALVELDSIQFITDNK